MRDLLLPLIFFLGLVSSASSQSTDTEPVQKEDIRLMLLLLANQSEFLEKQIKTLSSLSDSKDANERKAELYAQLDGVEKNFEAFATQLPPENSLEDQKNKTDWVAQIEGLTLPLLRAISDLTEKPRKIEKLKDRVSTLEIQLERNKKGTALVSKLLDYEKSIDPASDEKAAVYLEKLKILKEKYDPALAKMQLKSTRQQLTQELKETEPFIDSATRSVKSFFKHRGLNLLITILIFAFLWWSLMKLRSVLVGPKGLFKMATWLNKVLITAYSVLVVIICILSSLVSFYLLNDWLLLSILIIFLIAVVWTSRQLIPRMFQEVRLALNLGTVKEKERVLWNGVPWFVETIGLQANLVNENLEDRSILLPVGELVGMHSRPIVEEEPWFPTNTQDWVSLNDGTYGQISHQTQEQVVIRLRGGTLKFFATHEFLNHSPENLSSGFRLEIFFGLDYTLQNKICNEVPSLIDAYLRKNLSKRFRQPSPDFKFLKVRVDSAGAHALQLLVEVEVDGKAAKDYLDIPREIQHALIQISNEQSWTIPFNQITLNVSDQVSKRLPPLGS